MNTGKILIADDEPFIARILKLSLQQEGYEVIYANNGQKALALFQASRPDMVVTDVKMPQMTGRQLVESIRCLSDGGETPIVVMTSTLESENRDWVRSNGNVVFMGKPVSPRKLISVLHDFFENRKAS